jgi:hypothetical protein
MTESDLMGSSREAHRELSDGEIVGSSSQLRILNKIWKKQTDETLQRAQQQSIVSIRLYSIRMFCDDANIEPTSRLIFQIALEKTPKTFMFVKLEQIDDLLGDQPWMKGDMNALANVGSGRLVNVSWGARKKQTKRMDFYLLVLSWR